MRANRDDSRGFISRGDPGVTPGWAKKKRDGGRRAEDTTKGGWRSALNHEVIQYITSFLNTEGAVNPESKKILRWTQAGSAGLGCVCGRPSRSRKDGSPAFPRARRGCGAIPRRCAAGPRAVRAVVHPFRGRSPSPERWAPGPVGRASRHPSRRQRRRPSSGGCRARQSSGLPSIGRHLSRARWPHRVRMRGGRSGAGPPKAKARAPCSARAFALGSWRSVRYL